MSEWTDPAVIASCIGSAGAVLAAGAAVWYTIVTKGLLRTTADNTAVTRAIFEAAERPYVGMDEARLNARNATTASLFVKLKNHGSVPAHNVRTRVRVDLDGAVIAEKSIEEGITLFPGDNIHIHVPLQHDLLPAFTTTFAQELGENRMNLDLRTQYTGPGLTGQGGNRNIIFRIPTPVFGSGLIEARLGHPGQHERRGIQQKGVGHLRPPQRALER
jgi:hypothetical protein